jgi:hypothetical protein
MRDVATTKHRMIVITTAESHGITDLKPSRRSL